MYMSNLTMQVEYLIPGEVADRSGQLEEGDYILSVNGYSLIGMSKSQAIEVFRRVGNYLMLVISRPSAQEGDEIKEIQAKLPENAPSPDHKQPTSAHPESSDVNIQANDTLSLDHKQATSACPKSSDRKIPAKLPEDTPSLHQHHVSRPEDYSTSKKDSSVHRENGRPIKDFISSKDYSTPDDTSMSTSVTPLSDIKEVKLKRKRRESFGIRIAGGTDHGDSHCKKLHVRY